MSAIIMDGAALAKKIKSRIRREIEANGYDPGLAVVIVGHNPASLIYVRNKKKDCEECGIRGIEFALPEGTGEEELLGLIETLNCRGDIDGILVQLPLPGHIDERKVLRAICPEKDADAFNPFNVGLIVSGGGSFLPCTPAGIIELLDEYGIEIEGKNCVVIGRSNIVGKPLSLLLLQRNGTVTTCHSRTAKLGEFTRRADILVSAAGKRGLITADMVKPGAVVVDVAMNRTDDGKLCGDVAFDEVKQIASYITPVPGGIGPMTRVMLMRNTVTAYKNRYGE
ncbi:MAG: bifunctional methylenetetrahydrofolate dehydrogenase/methenyltetrahydrofolate cyclohydrolase FolD [Oscillospiraceae bacterium]|jgi:methylenetetrahydrofolate dehydrogenase (NADP+)/methenyltetrahydrofolate cyclohydrolase